MHKKYESFDSFMYLFKLESQILVYLQPHLAPKPQSGRPCTRIWLQSTPLFILNH